MTLIVPPLVQRDEALEARELALLALAVGDHLPHELALQVAALREQRVALAVIAAAPAAIAAWQPAAC